MGERSVCVERQREKGSYFLRTGRKYYFFGNNRTGWKTALIIWKNIQNEVQLPADIVKIGSCAFYNCTKMERISVYPKLVEVGSDAFMNCLNLRSLRMCAGVEEPTGLKQLLAQIKWQVEVSFERGRRERGSSYVSGIL